MRVVLPNIGGELSADWKVGQSQIQRDMRRFRSTVNQGWAIEHTDDGGHGDITATSITTQGASIGQFFNLPAEAPRFYATAGSVWTIGTINYIRATRIGELVHVMFRLLATDIDVTSAGLYISLPEFNAVPTDGTPPGIQLWSAGTVTWIDSEHSTSGIATVSALVQTAGDPVPRTYLQLDRISPTNATFSSWPASDDLEIRGIATFPVNPNNAPLPYSFV